MLQPDADQQVSSERGATMVFFAISIVAIFGLMGIVIDGGRAYAERRQMQSAADASALAGARALDEVLFEGFTDESRIYETALAQALANDGQAGTFECRLVSEAHIFVQDCPEVDDAALLAGVAGVQVVTDNTRETTFIRIVGQEGFTAAATATAQLQALRSGAGPLLVCATGGGGEFQDVPIIVLADPTDDDYTDNWKLNEDPAVFTTIYNLHGSNSSSDRIRGCGGDSGWKGVAEDGTFDIPGYGDTKNGDTAGPTRTKIAAVDGCGGEFKDFPDGCKLLVPLCVGPAGPGDEEKKRMYCVALGTFEITYADSNTHKGRFLEIASVVTEGEGGGLPIAGEAKLIKLTD